MRGRKLVAATLLAGMVASPMVMAEVLNDDALGNVSAQGFQVAAQVVGSNAQNINNDSVQLNNQAQQNAAGLAVTNSAASAANVGQNVAGLSGMTGGAVSQLNDQYADNQEDSFQGAFQYAAASQNVNNGSDQLNNHAQSDIAALAVTNTASSATNVGQNVAGLVHSITSSPVLQRNVQVALNSGTNVQYSMQLIGAGQDVNNGSAQLNNHAQQNAVGLAITNSASGATNVAQNVAGLVNTTAGVMVQSTDATAENQRVNMQYAYQEDADVQNMNNGSAQLNNNAQESAAGLAITNTASSATNVAQNVAGLVDTITSSNVAQLNKEVADNGATNTQDASTTVQVNADVQNMNNGSAQLNNNAQRNVAGLAVSNSASSALNVGQNIVGMDNSRVNNVAQRNVQDATDHSTNTQANAQGTFMPTAQNMNNGSTQLNNNAQQNAAGLALTNTASSAANVGQNIAGMVGGYVGTLSQTNLQSAVNY